MKTERLVEFKYENAATSFMVIATSFTERLDAPDMYIVRIFDQNDVVTLNPENRAAAMQAAERRIANFLRHIMVPVYLGE